MTPTTEQAAFGLRNHNPDVSRIANSRTTRSLRAASWPAKCWILSFFFWPRRGPDSTTAREELGRQIAEISLDPFTGRVFLREIAARLIGNLGARFYPSGSRRYILTRNNCLASASETHRLDRPPRHLLLFSGKRRTLWSRDHFPPLQHLVRELVLAHTDANNFVETADANGGTDTAGVNAAAIIGGASQG